MMTTKLYEGDIVEMPSVDPGMVLRARVVDPGERVTTVELLDAADPTDTEHPGPFTGDQVVVPTADLVLTGPAQGRGMIQ